MNAWQLLLIFLCIQSSKFFLLNSNIICLHIYKQIWLWNVWLVELMVFVNLVLMKYLKNVKTPAKLVWSTLSRLETRHMTTKTAFKDPMDWMKLWEDVSISLILMGYVKTLTTAWTNIYWVCFSWTMRYVFVIKMNATNIDVMTSTAIVHFLILVIVLMYQMVCFWMYLIITYQHM